MNVYGAEISTVGAALVLAGAVAQVAVCTGLGRIPLPIAKVASVICYIVGSSGLRGIHNRFLRLYRGGAAR